MSFHQLVCLDIATAQAFLRDHLAPLRAQSISHCKVLSTPFTCGDDKRLLCVCKSFQFPRKVNGYERSKLVIKAVATAVAPECLAEVVLENYKNVELDVNSDSSTVQAESSSADSTELDERERLRRMKISKAIKGRTPWNKGRKHSIETIQRIKERTRLALQDPKVRMKFKFGHAQSEETRMKIRIGVQMVRQKRREKRMVQDGCYYDWQNLIAEASRSGCVGEEELQWDSYKVLSEKLKLEWMDIIEQGKTMSRRKGGRTMSRRKVGRTISRQTGPRTAPESTEQRKKIAEAIATKWADLAYRRRVCSGMAKYHKTSSVGAEGESRWKPSGSGQSTKWDTWKNISDTNRTNGSDATTPVQRLRSQRCKTPLYKDPSASLKLEMIKNVKEQRDDTETKRTEAIARARLLIAEAEKAAKILEICAMKSPVALASLMETRKLIAESVQSIEAISTGQIMSNENDGYSSFGPTELVTKVETDTGRRDSNQAAFKTKILASNQYKDRNFTKLSFHNKANTEKEHFPGNSSVYGVPSFDLETLFEQSRPAKKPGELEPNGNSQSEHNPPVNGSKVWHMNKETTKSITTTKKWVCGRLVEVPE